MYIIIHTEYESIPLILEAWMLLVAPARIPSNTFQEQKKKKLSLTVWVMTARSPNKDRRVSTVSIPTPNASLSKMMSCLSCLPIHTFDTPSIHLRRARKVSRIRSFIVILGFVSLGFVRFGYNTRSAVQLTQRCNSVGASPPLRRTTKNRPDWLDWKPCTTRYTHRNIMPSFCTAFLSSALGRLQYCLPVLP